MGSPYLCLFLCLDNLVRQKARDRNFEMSQRWLECAVVLRTHNTVFTHMHPNKAEQINNKKRSAMQLNNTAA